MTCFTPVCGSAAATVCAKFSSTIDGVRAAIGELMLELRHRVLRIDVHGDHAGAQDAEQHDGRLQRIRQHDRDAIAGSSSRHRLQVRRERAARALDVGERQRRVEIREGGLRREPREARFEQRHERRVAVGIDLGRHARRDTRRARAYGASRGSSSGPSTRQTLANTIFCPAAFGWMPSGCMSSRFKRDVGRAGSRSSAASKRAASSG